MTMRRISVPDAVPGRDGHLPNYKRRQARRSVHEQKPEGSMNLLERTPHVRTHARTHVIPSTHSCARSLSRFCPLPFFFIFIAERDTDCVADEISAQAVGWRKPLLEPAENRSKLRELRKREFHRAREMNCGTRASRGIVSCFFVRWNNTRYYENSWHKSLWKFRMSRAVISKNEGVMLQWHAI